jgi:glyoxylase-like metal-dependent hydrolase (beta-lactamase superfamily II)
MAGSIKIGAFECVPLSDGSFYLDGGAMFGVVPKIFWNKTNPADEKNRIHLGLHPLLIKHPERRILIDTGIGEKFNAKFQSIYCIDKSETIEGCLKLNGMKPEEIDMVIITHLHFDHGGGNTKHDTQGNVIPKFPNATYIIQEAEWQVALTPNERSKASYLKENYVPLEEYGLLRLIKGTQEIFPGIKCILTGGHTEGHQIVTIEDKGDGAIYWADLMPTTSHVRIPYIMGYDLFPLDVIKNKQEFIKMSIERGWTSFFEHDPQYTHGKISLEDGKPRFIPGEA